jgi:hypothetical protein
MNEWLMPLAIAAAVQDFAHALKNETVRLHSSLRRQPRALEALVWRAAKPVAQIQYLN